MRWASLPIVLLLFLSCRFSAVVLRVHAPDFFSTFLTWDHSGSQTGLDGYPKVVNALAFAQNLPLSKKTFSTYSHHFIDRYGRRIGLA